MTMPQLDQLSACPSCEEPLEEGDRFCGACGTDLAAAVARAAEADDDHPTLPVNGAAPQGAHPAAGSPGQPLPAQQTEPGQNQPERDRPGQSQPGQDPAAVGAPGPVRTPTQPDFSLPPALPHPPLPPEEGTGTPDATGEAEGAGNAPPRAGTETAPGAFGAAPAVHDPAVPDPRTADPRTVLDGPGSGPELLGPRCVACGTGTIDDDGYCEHCGHKQPCERDHMEQALDSVAAASDRGLRHHRNEDYFEVTEITTPEGSPATIAVVCDGVSSATRPDEASAAAAAAAGASMREAVAAGVHPQQAMHDALVAASEAVNVLAAQGPVEPSKNAPACTIVSALTADGILTVGWVGDSRAYWVPDDRTAQSARLTEDDSWAAQMVAAGLMSEAEAYADSRAHAITGWLGADAYELDPHTASFKPDRAGVVVVCTDGLWNYAESAEEMAAAVPLDALTRPLHSAQHLVGYALDGGGHDNVTVAVVPFPESSGRAGSA